MANEILVKTGSQFRFCITGSFSPADNGHNFTIGTPTDVAITLASLPDQESRLSAKVDLGATRPRVYEVLAAIDFTGESPDSDGHIDLHWLPSVSGTAATGNVMGTDGTDADADSGTNYGATDTGLLLTELIPKCQFIGSLQCHSYGGVQNGFVALFSPSSRYGQLLVVNNSGDVVEDDDVENHIVFNEIIDEVQ